MIWWYVAHKVFLISSSLWNVWKKCLSKNHISERTMRNNVVMITYDNHIIKLLKLIIFSVLFSCCCNVDHESISFILRIISLFCIMIFLRDSYVVLLSNITYSVDGRGLSIPNFWKLFTTSGIFFSKKLSASSFDENITFFENYLLHLVSFFLRS